MGIKVRFGKLLTGSIGYNSNDRIFEISSFSSTAYIQFYWGNSKLIPKQLLKIS